MNAIFMDYKEIEEARVELAAMGITTEEDGEGSSNMA